MLEVTYYDMGLIIIVDQNISTIVSLENISCDYKKAYQIF